MEWTILEQEISGRAKTRSAHLMDRRWNRGGAGYEVNVGRKKAVQTCKINWACHMHQWLMETCLAGLHWSSFLFYFDDISIYSEASIEMVLKGWS